MIISILYLVPNKAWNYRILQTIFDIFASIFFFFSKIENFGNFKIKNLIYFYFVAIPQCFNILIQKLYL